MISTKRLVPYGLVSTALAAWTLLHAFSSRPNFYSAAVYLSGSSACVLILCNYAVFLSLCAAKTLSFALFGELRLIERERLHERLWYTVTESLLALTIFRDEFDIPFFAWFASLLFLKVFHWLSMDRIESMQQAPRVTIGFHVRMITTLFMLCNIYIALILYTCEHILLRGPSVMAMFASEYIILYCSLGAMIWRYAIETLDRITESDAEWETKSMWLFYGDLVFDFCKLVTYVSFFTFILTFYSLPLNLLRDVYITTKSFLRKCVQLRRLKEATKNMESRYANATTLELEELNDKTCIICREEMTLAQLQQHPSDEGDRAHGGQEAAAGRHGARAPHTPGQRLARLFKLRRVVPNETPKKLSCGHMFHFNCLKSWLERQQSCPTCRRPVLEVGAQRGPAREPPANQQRGDGQAQQQQQPPRPADPQQQQQPGQDAEGARPILRHILQGMQENGPPGDLLRGALARHAQGQQQRPGTPTDNVTRDRVANPMRRSSRSARPSPSRTSSSTRLAQQANGQSSAGASPEPRHQALPENPFMRFVSQMPPNLLSYAPPPDHEAPLSASTMPDGSSFTLPRVVAPGLGVPSSIILPSSSSNSASVNPQASSSSTSSHRRGQVAGAHGSPGLQVSTSELAPPTSNGPAAIPDSPAFAIEPDRARQAGPPETNVSVPTGTEASTPRPSSLTLPSPLRTVPGAERQENFIPSTPTVLPPELSEEQLRTLGTLTREGLQERLTLLDSARDGLEAWQKRLNMALDACTQAEQARSSESGETPAQNGMDSSNGPSQAIEQEMTEQE